MWQPRTIEEQIERFCMEYEENENGCWIWVGPERNGYGQTWWDGKQRRTHRVAWFLYHGKWPTHTLDHLCRVKRCVNPAHLEDVPHAVNVKRGDSGLKNRLKTHCPQGHPYDRVNTFGRRYCYTCSKNRTYEYRRAARALRQA